MKNIIITGASRGIGKELALLAASQGHQVLALSRQINTDLQAHPAIQLLSVDLSNENEIQSVSNWIANNWKQVDVLIHNAGALQFKPFTATTLTDFENIYKVNVFGVAALTQVCVPFLRSGSHVVAISSMGGVQGSAKFAGLAAYSSSKAAVITLMELLAEEYKEEQISFNALALGAVQTEMLAEAFPGYQAPVTAQEMANYILDFSLQGHQWYNGKVLPVSKSTP
ncbi:MAG: short-chain dehydrogenase [Flavobacterium sp. BFFFF2]|nr:MAG: short-chain dehydrogenase [Flavobacterium sp. BFFFF2]